MFCWFEVCVTLVHIVALLMVEDVVQLGSVLSERYDVLAVHLAKHVSTANQQAGKGLRNFCSILYNAFIWYSSFWTPYISSVVAYCKTL